MSVVTVRLLDHIPRGELARLLRNAMLVTVGKAPNLQFGVVIVITAIRQEDPPLSVLQGRTRRQGYEASQKGDSLKPRKL